MIMRNDALDRFGTPLEQRFSKYIEEILKKIIIKILPFQKINIISCNCYEKMKKY